MFSLLEVILRAGNFYRQIYSLLESLERLVEPRAPLSPSPNIGMLTLSAPALIAAAEPAQKEPLLSLISGYLASLEKQARELDLDSTGKRLKRLMDYVASLNAVTVETYGDEKLKHDIRVLREAFEDDLKERFIFFPSHERFKKWVTTDPFEGAKKAFPSALSDLSWAATSFVEDNSTACVFYLMRAIEQVMRVLASHLGIKKVGKKGMPIEYAEWAIVCDQLQAKIGALQQAKRSAKKSADLKFYSDVASQIEWFNDIWRKNVAHARTLYRLSDAENAIRRAKDLLDLLATRVKESP